jgi:hypothetical protein
MTNREISRRLRVSSETVKYHLKNALGKLSLARRSELRRWRGTPADSGLHRQGAAMTAEVKLGPIGQISRQVSDIPKAVERRAIHLARRSSISLRRILPRRTRSWLPAA